MDSYDLDQGWIINESISATKEIKGKKVIFLPISEFLMGDITKFALDRG